jgi:hypothetical protein
MTRDRDPSRASDPGLAGARTCLAWLGLALLGVPMAMPAQPAPSIRHHGAVPTLTTAAALRVRTISQWLSSPAVGTEPAELASWFGAIQAQDLAAALWAFGVRLPDSSCASLEGAVASGSILRTWPMRGTMHFVAAEDARWLLRTAGVRALRTSSQRWRTLGLDQATADAAVDVFRGALDRTPLLTRSAMLGALQDAGISAAGQRGYHLLLYAAQVGVTCVGPNRGKEQTYALLDTWAPRQRDLEGDEALGELVLRYFRSHGPATRQDFQRWAGLTAAASRTGLAIAGDALIACDVAGQEAFVDPAALDRASPAPVVRLLPAFDEYVLGYQDRSSFIAPDRMHDVVPGQNGLFRPSVLADGRIIGTWTRAVSSRGVRVAVHYFDRPQRNVAEAVHQAAEGFAEYLDLPLLD